MLNILKEKNLTKGAPFSLFFIFTIVTLVGRGVSPRLLSEQTGFALKSILTLKSIVKDITNSVVLETVLRIEEIWD